MIHPNEPDVHTLKEIERGLIKAESTDENMQKLKAITSQIARHIKEKEAVDTEIQPV